MKETLTADRVRSVLFYEPDTGVFRWRDRPRSDFKTSQAYGAWRSSCLGKEAGYLTTGYRRISINCVEYFAHRLAWLYVHGDWPPQYIDHINGDGTDNRIENLRAASPEQNQRNCRMSARNTSGVVGVRCTPYGTFSASIWRNSKIISLGSFKTKEEAIAARKAAERQLGYHPNHGRAA